MSNVLSFPPAATPLPPLPAKPHRGFTILYELFFVVLVAEFGIDGASVAMAWVYAKQFAPDDPNTQTLSIVGALVLCIFEAARIPCAFALRTETSATIKALCVAGILASAPITVFNLSQLFTIPAQARLNAVHDTGAAVASAKDRAATFADRQRLAREEVERDERIFHEASARAQSGNGDLASLPKSCWQGRCAKDSREKDLRANSNEARAAVADAKKQLDKARQALLVLDGAKVTAQLRAAESERDKAIAASPLHRYAAMIFGAEPSAVSDEVMAWTVRLFVGVPSVLGAFLAALLTMIAVKPARKVEAPAAEKTFEAPDTLPFDLSAHVPAAFVHRVADEVEERRKPAPENSAPPSPAASEAATNAAPAKRKKAAVANGGAARPRGRPRKTNGEARSPPPPSSSQA
jgi:hypothetical protein